MGIDGRLSSRNYENNQGQRVYVTEVTVDNFALLEPKRNNGGYPSANSPFSNNASPTGNVDLSNLPFDKNGDSTGKADGEPQSLDDVPF